MHRMDDVLRACVRVCVYSYVVSLCMLCMLTIIVVVFSSMVD